MWSRIANPFSLTAFKNAPNPKFVQNLSRRLFFGVPIGGPKFVKNMSKIWKTSISGQIFKFSTNFWQIWVPPDWNPEKQSSGQILGKFAVRGVFECCKGKKGSQKSQRFESLRFQRRFLPSFPVIIRVLQGAAQMGGGSFTSFLRFCGPLFCAANEPFPIPSYSWDQSGEPTVPPGTKPIHAGKNSWGINFCANTCGACIRTRAHTGKYFRGGISRVLCQILRGIHSVRIDAAPVFAPARIQQIFLANYLCIGFVPGGTRGQPWT